MIRAEVVEARARQAIRLRGTGARCNAELDTPLLRRVGEVDEGAEAVLQDAYQRGTLSVRGQARALRVARTVADLEASRRVLAGHVEIALALHPEGGLAVRAGVGEETARWA